MVAARDIPVTAGIHNEAGSETASKAPIHSNRAPRIALYSQGMMGFGHIRRNASIAQALRRSALQPAIVMIAEAWQAGALLMPAGIDCVTLPAIRKEANGEYNPRFLLDVSGAATRPRGGGGREPKRHRLSRIARRAGLSSASSEVAMTGVHSAKHFSERSCHPMRPGSWWLVR